MVEQPTVPHTPTAACELKRKVIGAAAIAGWLLVAAPALSWAQEHPPTETATAAEAHEGAEAHGGLLSGLLWPTANFIVLVGILYYFLRTPAINYFTDRSITIRKELVEAAAIKADATAKLEVLDAKLKALPGEIESLRTRGAEEIAAEEQRIAAAAAAERERLLEQTRMEIDLQLRRAKREILEHAADLSVQLATERLKKDVTPDDQAKLVDRYLRQVQSAKPTRPGSQA